MVRPERFELPTFWSMGKGRGIPSIAVKVTIVPSTLKGKVSTRRSSDWEYNPASYCEAVMKLKSLLSPLLFAAVLVGSTTTVLASSKHSHTTSSAKSSHKKTD